MKKKRVLISFLSSFIITSAAIFSAAYSWELQLFVIGTCFFTGGFIYPYMSYQVKFSKLMYSFIILLPFFLIFAIYVLLFQLQNGYPQTIFQIVSYLFGFWVGSFQNRDLKKYFLITFFLVFIAISSFVGIPNYNSYLYGKKVEKPNALNGITLLDKYKNEIDLTQFHGKVVVLDFWNSACSICFKKFPDYNDLYHHYEDNTEVEIFAVNLKLKKRDFEDIVETTEKLNYDFPFLFTNDSSSAILYKSLNISGVPTLVILDKNGQVSYSGVLNTDKRVFVNNAYMEIEKALKKETNHK